MIKIKDRKRRKKNIRILQIRREIYRIELEK